jgi:hypothetical protein
VPNKRASFGIPVALPASMKSRVESTQPILGNNGSCKRTLFDVLTELKIELPPPEKLTNHRLTAKLWEVIHALLDQSIVLGNTDHLSDRELYTLLRDETLHKQFVISRHYTLQVDMTKTGVNDGMPIYLKYYASEAQRRLYLQFYPRFKMPKHVDPPRRRDHLIPDVAPQSRKKRVN